MLTVFGSVDDGEATVGEAGTVVEVGVSACIVGDPALSGVPVAVGIAVSVTDWSDKKLPLWPAKTGFIT